MVMNTHRWNTAKAPFQTSVTTLVVDDSPFMLKTLSQILRGAGDFDLVGTATDGCQALRYVSMIVIFASLRAQTQEAGQQLLFTGLLALNQQRPSVIGMFEVTVPFVGTDMLGDRLRGSHAHPALK